MKVLAKLAGRELLLLGQFYFSHSAFARTVRLPGFGNFKDYSDYLAMAFTYHRTGRRFKYDLHIDFQSRNIPLHKKKTPMLKRILNPSPLEKSGNFS